MFRFNLIASLLLTLALIVGGCAKKTVVAVDDKQKTPVTEPANLQPDMPIESKPVVAPTDSLSKITEMELATILFEFDSHRLTTDSQQLLKNNAEQLLENTEARATIEGHCDERGSDGYNLALGERRAVAAKNYLAGLGISPERLAVISYGEERPASSGHTEIDWQQNRRVEFKKRY